MQLCVVGLIDRDPFGLHVHEEVAPVIGWPL
jgi:hypothetical protein